MKLNFENLSDVEVLGVLHRAKVVSRKGKLSLQRYPSRQERRDNRQRSVFRVWAGSQPVAHLTVGRSLGELQRRSQEFHRHNPAISCQPLFFLRQGGVDFFGQEYLGPFNLEEALSARQIDMAVWQQAVGQVAAALGATAQPSTMSRLMQELEQFEQQVLGIDSLQRLDHVFLRDTIFPLIRLGAMNQAPSTAWSNGDFIARNIILDPSGRARLIDYEFARRTHFPAGDWFRMGHFSQLPESVNLENLPGLANLPPWLEIRCWLEHAVKLTEVSSLVAVQSDLPKISQRLARLVERTTSRQYDSVFFSLAPTQEQLAQPALAVPDDAMAVEWSRHGSTQKHQTSTVALQAHHWSEVHVDMSAPAGRALSTRLRLPTTPCIVELRSVEVHGRERSDILWTIDSAQLGSVLSCSGNILETPTAEGLGLVHFGGESIVAFPPIRLAKSETAVGLVFWVRYVPSVADFTQRLRQAFAEGDVPAILSGGQAIAQIEGGGIAREITAQLFYPEDNLYSEESAIRSTLSGNNAWSELSFDIPALPKGAILRLDPADQPGMIEIGQLELVPADAGRGSAHRRKSHHGLEGLHCEGDALLLPDEESVRIFSFGPDPTLKLAPLDDDLAGRPCRLILSIRFSPQVPPTVWAQALLDQRNANISLNVRLDQAVSSGSSVAKELENKLSQTSHELRHVGEVVAQVGANQDKLLAELAKTQGDLAERDQITEALNQKLTASQTEVASIRADLDRMAQEKIQAAAALAASQTEVESLHAELGQVRTAADAARLRETEQSRAAEETLQRYHRGITELEAARRDLIQLQERLQREEREREQGTVALATANAEIRKLSTELELKQDLAAAARQANDHLEARLQTAIAHEAAMVQAAAEIADRHAHNISELTGAAQLEKLRLEDLLQAAQAREAALAHAAVEMVDRHSQLTRELETAMALGQEQGRQRIELEITLARSREQAAQREGELQALLARSTEDRQAALGREAEAHQHSARVQQERQEIQVAMATAHTRHEAEREAHRKDREAMEQTHAEFVLSLHALNAGLLDTEHQAAIISRELQKAQDENARLRDLMAKASRRLSVRLDREATRMLAGKPGDKPRS